MNETDLTLNEYAILLGIVVFMAIVFTIGAILINWANENDDNEENLGI